MKRKNNRRGFTMAELLIVVAIVIVLTGVGFVAVQAHQRNLAQLEADTIAKEIFFAAQNHLTMAEGQGYLGNGVNFGSNDESEDGVYYFTVPSTNPNTSGTALNLMLPFGSIDDTIRSAGNYVIRYQAKPGRVLDVWYGRRVNELYAGRYDADPATISLANLKQKQYSGKVIGHYGGDDAMAGGVVLNAPYIEVENAERLTVRIKTADVNKDADGNVLKNEDGSAITVSVKLIIRGETSGALAAVPVLPNQNQRVKASGTSGFDYDITLDDITTPYQAGTRDGGHFADITTDMASATSASVPAIDVLAGAAFIPGENIIVQAVAFSNSALASIAYSNEWTTNSLFADVEDGSSDSQKTALIGNMRHLANLDKLISGVNTVGTDKLSITEARQTSDLAWKYTTTPTDADAPKAFTAVMGEDVSIYKKDETTGTSAGYWQPLTIDYPLLYDGAEGSPIKCHTITGVKASSAGDDSAGLFGEIKANSGAITVKNLEMIDFDIAATGSGSAGALAGKVTGTETSKATVQNVLARNTKAFDKLETATVNSATGAAGGLIGKTTGAELEKSAAALVVKSTGGNAGGLVGESSGGKIESSYSGGHTANASYYQNGATIYNVIAQNCAGGLVGDAGGTAVNHCYSTCSANATGNGNAYAGGLVGWTQGLLKNSYAAGLVNGRNAGALAGSILSSKPPEACQYLEIVNETISGGVVSYLPPVPNYVPNDETVVPAGSTKLNGVSRVDFSVTSYNAFSGEKTNWKDALAYDSALKTLYPKAGDAEKCGYNFRTVEQLGGSTVLDTATATAPADFVAIHYGDWPAPETLVVNQ